VPAPLKSTAPSDIFRCFDRRRISSSELFSQGHAALRREFHRLGHAQATATTGKRR